MRKHKDKNNKHGQTTIESGQRLDKWLWAARFFKTRSLAAEAVQGGKVHLDGQRAKPARQVSVGASLQISRGDYKFDIVVTGLNQQRRPAKEAQLLYEESLESITRREEIALQLREVRVTERLIRGDGKPNKKQRREIVNFRKL